MMIRKKLSFFSIDCSTVYDLHCRIRLLGLKWSLLFETRRMILWFNYGRGGMHKKYKIYLYSVAHGRHCPWDVRDGCYWLEFCRAAVLWLVGAICRRIDTYRAVDTVPSAIFLSCTSSLPVLKLKQQKSFIFVLFCILLSLSSTRLLKNTWRF